MNTPPMQPDDLTTSERKQIADILRRRANEIATFKQDDFPGSVDMALNREMDRLRRLASILEDKEKSLITKGV